MANIENVKLWVAALRSGEFDQTSGTLAEIDDDGEAIGFCCLGVACEVARRNGLEMDVRSEYILRVYNDYSDLLPPAVRDWLGVDDTNPALVSENIVETEEWDEETQSYVYSEEAALVSAADLNDGYSYSFGQIADAIERTFLS